VKGGTRRSHFFSFTLLGSRAHRTCSLQPHHPLLTSPYSTIIQFHPPCNRAYILFLTYSTVATGGWTRDIFARVEVPLKIVQTAAVAEIFHSATGLVRSPFFTTFIQVLSRLWALWGIVNHAPDACSGGAISLLKVGPVHLQLNLLTLLTCWCVSEVLRYGLYAAKEGGLPIPHPLLWLRYSAFLVLYPVGVASEMSMVALALPTIRSARPWSLALPNALNWGFDYYWACFVAIACYVPGLPELYFHMLKQRGKVLGGGGGGAAGGAPRGRGAARAGPAARTRSARKSA
jgi:very-long-chain (3R)-3-hydroxyacyl-CoA dehydratase